MKKINMKRKINETLLELLCGIAVWGLFWQAFGVWFVAEKASCSLGLWSGVLLAAACAVNIYKSLDTALDLSEKDAQKYMVSRNVLRYGLIAIILGILMITEAANPLCAFLGVIGLKVAAYLQPFTHRFLRRR